MIVWFTEENYISKSRITIMLLRILPRLLKLIHKKDLLMWVKEHAKRKFNIMSKPYKVLLKVSVHKWDIFVDKKEQECIMKWGIIQQLSRICKNAANHRVSKHQLCIIIRE